MSVRTITTETQLQLSRDSIDSTKYQPRPNRDAID